MVKFHNKIALPFSSLIIILIGGGINEPLAFFCATVNLLQVLLDGGGNSQRDVFHVCLHTFVFAWLLGHFTVQKTEYRVWEVSA